MNVSSVWQMLVFTIPSVIGALLSVAIMYVLIKKPSWLLFYFFLFYLISVSHLAAVSITSFLKKSTGSFGLQQFWRIGLAISRLRYLFLVLFVHSAYRFRVTPALTVFMAIIVGLGIAVPFFVYSIIPNLMEIVVVLYAFVYWLTLYLKRNKLSISSRRQGLLRAVLACSGFFLTGILLDLLEDIPQASVYVSILLIDFYPVYLVSIGLVMALWAVRDLYHPLEPREPKNPKALIFLDCR